MTELTKHEPTTVYIKPSTGLAALNLRDLWTYRQLVYFMVWRDVKVKYKQTLLGMAWAVVQPVMTLIVFTFLFDRVAKLPTDGIPYPVFSFTDVVPKLIRAMAKAVMFYRTNKEGSFPTLKEHLGIDSPKDAGIVWDQTHNIFGAEVPKDLFREIFESRLQDLIAAKQWPADKPMPDPDLMAAWPEAYITMGLTAENVAQRFKISRQDQDTFAYESHQKAARAQADGRFKEQILPLKVIDRGFEGGKAVAREKIFDKDECIRADTSMEALSMIAVGEATGALDSMLEKIADFYDEEVDAAVAALTSMLEPLLMLFLGGAIGGLVIAMYLPIFGMAAAMGS